MAVLAREARFHLAGRISLIATGRNAGVQAKHAVTYKSP
jgi:hypothetical protein